MAAWKPTNVELFKADFLALKTNPELALKHNGSVNKVLKYITECQQMGTLPARKDIPGFGTVLKNKLSKMQADIPNSAEATGEKEDRKVASDGTVTIEKDTLQPVRTLEDLVLVCEIDLDAFEITSWGVKKWDTAIKAQRTEEDGSVTWFLETRQMFGVSVKLKPRTIVQDIKAELALMIEEAAVHCPKEWPTYNIENDPDARYMLELSIADHHFGKLAWWEECGESYDLKIAEQMFRDAVIDLLSKARHYKFEEILFVVGNDLFNSDNRNNQTTAGTPQTTEGRYQKTLRIVRKVMQDVIEELLMPRTKKVRVVMVQGNHDTETVFMFGEILDAWFRHCPTVEIDNSPTQRKYVEYGQNMLLFTHGNEEKHEGLPLIMAQERKEMWGRTKFREVHLGHFHKRKETRFIDVDEHKGVCVRILPSLCAAEDWHTSRGYIGNMRSAQAFIWEHETGLAAQFNHNAKPFVKAPV